MEFSTSRLEKLAIASCSVMLFLAVFNSCSGGLSDVEDQELGSPKSSESATATTASRASESPIVVSPAASKAITVPPTGTPGNIDSKGTSSPTPTDTAIPSPLPTNTSSPTPTDTAIPSPLPTNTSSPTPTHTPTPDMFRGYDTPATATPAPTSTPIPTPTPTSTPTPTPLASATGSVAVNNYSFSPSSVTIRSGGKVTWSFQSGTHTATGSVFNSGTKMAGQSFEYTFNSAGTYGYVCSFHGSMTGTVTVQ